MGIIFHRDMRVGKNTSQTASVEFLRHAQKLCAQQAAILLAEKTKFFRQVIYWISVFSPEIVVSAEALEK